MLRTAQRTKLCRECPMARTADLVGDSVSLLILRDLLEGPKRFSELSLSLNGVSSRTLTLKLKSLESCGLVIHTDVYGLTAKGKALKPVVDSMRQYGKKYL